MDVSFGPGSRYPNGLGLQIYFAQGIDKSSTASRFHPQVAVTLVTMTPHREKAFMRPAAQTLADLLQDRAGSQPDLPLYRFLTDGEDQVQQLTCGELDGQARQIARRLRSRGQLGDRVLLLAPPGLDFIRGLFGCQYAGMVPVATFPPHPRRKERSGDRLAAIARSSQAHAVLVTPQLRPCADAFAAPVTELSDAQDAGAETWTVPNLDSGAAAVLQYTSGSTCTPRGVVLSHSNLLHNSEFIRQRFEHDSTSCGVIWLPPYHDMGLIGGILQPLYAGFPVVLMSPLHFLQRPVRWLRAITRYHATTSGGPNFAFEACASQIPEEDRKGLDLQSWRTAFCGAEPIRPSTMQRFSAEFAPHGFRRTAFFPCYGLAEATLMVTSHRAGQEARCVSRAGTATHAKPTLLTSCGSAAPDQQVIVVDPATLTPVAPGDEGEIWVAGPSVAGGYWNDTDQTATVWGARTSDGAGPFLRTGDLGFCDQEELFITGRLKDVIILNGRNYYPQDLEAAAAGTHEVLQPGGIAAFSTTASGKDAEQLVLVAEIKLRHRRLNSNDIRAVKQSIRRAVVGNFDIPMSDICLVTAGELPRTTSGKIRRFACREAYETGALRQLDATPELPGVHTASPAAARTQRRLALLMVLTPLIGLLAAVIASWGQGIYAFDLAWLIGLYVATVLGVEVGFHRHFSHRSFQASPLVRVSLGILGSMAAQGPILFWVATHRRHHAYSDRAGDPHSPRPLHKGLLSRINGIWHAHVGWLFRAEQTSAATYAPDLLRDPLVFRLSQLYPVWVLLGLALPSACGLYFGWAGALRGFLWGGLVRIFLVHHATWSVNSLCHLYGSRPFETRDASTNNGWLVLTSLGGSWHNNHHAYPSSATTGFRPWQIDPSGWVIHGLARAGWAWDVRRPDPVRFDRGEARPTPEVEPTHAAPVLAEAESA